MKKLISLILVILLITASAFTLTACDDDDCPICGGSGYYQKKDCPGCP